MFSYLFLGMEKFKELQKACVAKGFRCEITPNDFAWVYDGSELIGYTFKSELPGAHPFYFVDELIKRVNER